MRGRLQIRYTVDGVRYEETLDIQPSRSGVAEAVRIRRERIAGRTFGAAVLSMPFESLAQEYLDKADLERSTRNAYRDSLNIYWAALRGRDAGAITAADLIALDDAIAWPSTKTRNNALIPLRQVLRYAVSRGYARSNPAEALRAAKRKRPDPDPYTISERDALLSWLDGTLAGPFFRVAFGTGARTGELLAVRWQDFDGQALYISQARVRGALKSTKTNVSRKVLLMDDTISVLRAMPRPIRGGVIFTNQYGRHYQSGYHLNRWFKRAHTATGVRLREGPYPWRSTYASVALSAGVKPSLIAAQLGHRLDVLLTVYAKYLQRDDDAAELGKMGIRREETQSKTI
jgi:integrase